MGSRIVAPSVEVLEGLQDPGRDHRSEFRRDVLEGLSAPRKSIPSKYFYDFRGAQLFERICRLEEYYLTRTETAILHENAAEIGECIGPDAVIVEFGSGSSAKVRILLDACPDPAAYVPIDISRDHLVDSAIALARENPGLAVLPVHADFTRDLALPEGLPAGRRVGFFPGSTVGNFSPSEARAFLVRTTRTLGPRGGLVIGVDLKKDRRILDLAYNDARGVTAAFNLNLLARINRELGGTFDLRRFRHRARYVPELGRIEMHLVSLAQQQVRVDRTAFGFSEGETIHTENSHKYEPSEFAALAVSAGFTPTRTWVDGAGLFSVHYIEVASGGPNTR